MVFPWYRQPTVFKIAHSLYFQNEQTECLAARIWCFSCSRSPRSYLQQPERKISAWEFLLFRYEQNDYYHTILGKLLVYLCTFHKIHEQVAIFVLPRAFIIVFSFIFFEFMYSLHYSKKERKTWYNMLISGMFMYKNFKNIL